MAENDNKDFTFEPKQHHLVDSEITLPLIDRIRLIFGSRLYVQVHIGTQWRVGKIETKSRVGIEKIFAFKAKSST